MQKLTLPQEKGDLLNFAIDFGKKTAYMGLIEMRGRWYRWSKKDTVDDYLSFDMARFAQSINLQQWCTGSWQWTWNSGRKASISYSVEPGRRGVRLQYTSNGKAHDYLVHFVTTQPHFGGLRHWWLCPSCGRRVRILYGGGIFACRQCYNLTYETTQKGGDLLTTIDNRLYRIRRKLRASGGVFDSFPAKPPKMHFTTYERLMREYVNLHEMRDYAFISEAASLGSILKTDDSLSLPSEALTQHVKQAWQEHKADPARIPDRWRELASRLPDAPTPPPPSRLTLGELATLASVPLDFAKEAVTEGLLRPDQGRTTRRKRYREPLKKWLIKLWKLRNDNMSWAEIHAWVKRRFKPEHAHEKAWPVGYPKTKE